MLHTQGCKDYGTNVVAGVTPGKGGQDFEGVPIFNSVLEAVKATKGKCFNDFSPTSICCRCNNGGCSCKNFPLIVAITEGVPVVDRVSGVDFVNKKGCGLIGPNCPGIITPGQSKIGIMPGAIHKAGGIGIVSRSGTLTYEAVGQITRVGLGQSNPYRNRR
ncbi:MAG: hypothetical protein CM1200mP30_00030 [Pseudomonadota bacterium]|nr:MAG: hypothetical protein CM1200mP30_00030 [Pseudomonadota bacterium]